MLEILPFGETNVFQVILSMVLLLIFFIFLPKLMLLQIMQKLRATLRELERYSSESEEIFLRAVMRTGKVMSPKKLRESLDPVKNMVISFPTAHDPYGIIKKIEHVLDTSEHRLERYIDAVTLKASKDQKANLSMGLKGVYTTHQLFILIRHLERLISKSDNIQLGATLQLFLPLYKELAEANRYATEAFVNQIPIGDSIGPMVAANFMKNKAIEISEDVVVSEEVYNGKKLYVLKSNGPGSRLGKYGDAVAKIMKKAKIKKIIMVDAGLRFEGEETGKIVEGIGVLMGGFGVEKSKIEDLATKYNIPLEGIIIKQSASQASMPMHRKIFYSMKNAVNSIEAIMKDTKGPILLLGVGNTVGVGNSKSALKDIRKRLSRYWKIMPEDKVSYSGLLKAFPFGGVTGRLGGNSLKEGYLGE